MDANGAIFPLAFAIAANESISTWGMFLDYLRQHVIKDRMGICVISDRNAGILHNMFILQGWQPPCAYHRYCLRHLKANFQKAYRIAALCNWMWAAVTEHQEKKFNIQMDIIRRTNEEAFHRLNAINKDQWTLHQDEGTRRGMLTTNSSESFNDLLKSARGLPVTAMVRMTFKQVVEQFANRSKEARAHAAAGLRWTPKPSQLFEYYKYKAQKHDRMEYNSAKCIFELTTNVHQGKGVNVYTICEISRTCTCGKWQSYHMPCSHAFKCFITMGKNASEYMAEEYTVENYARTYAGRFYPLGSESYWPLDPFSMVANKAFIRKFKKNAYSRIHNEMDVPLGRYTQKCSFCNYVGHDKRKCPLRHDGQTTTRGGSTSRGGGNFRGGRSSSGGTSSCGGTSCGGGGRSTQGH